jgi:oxygen-independent coproporphyrinogen-3 oxidase
MDRSTIKEYLDSRTELAPGTKIQYGHPSPRFWEPQSSPIAGLLECLGPARGLALYVHIPFCVPTEPSDCGFCLFAREDLAGYDVVRDYVDSLLLELDQCAAVTGRRSLQSLYFGGGTPNILKPAEIRRLFARIHDHFDLTEETEVTFEGYPVLFTAELLELLLELGCNRISLGVQTLDPNLLRHSGRHPARKETIEAIRFCAEHSIRCSADLITGWFDQTAEDVVADAEQLIDWGVTGICNHLLAVSGDSEFGRRADQLPSSEMMAEAFLAARTRMLDLGFRADSYCDYASETQPVVRYLDMYRDILSNDRIGIGYGANSLLAGTPERPGRTWKNVASLPLYRERVRSGAGPAESGFDFEREDLVLLYVLKGLEGSPFLTEAGYAERFGGELRADFQAWWDVLEEKGWLHWNDGAPLLTGLGLYFTATIQRCFAEPRNRALRQRAGSSHRLGVISSTGVTGP